MPMTLNHYLNDDLQKRVNTGVTAGKNFIILALWVNGLSDEKLEDLVGEEAKTKRRRRVLKKINELEAGRKVLLT
ncbi:uncharacterized protein N7477_006861 [Penicillium maclennaniae]|uniref:uncharacterized protein n=1 Tax=Penicillium maclennaniae TaxID=1343394 RepID=UPI00253FF8A0|nr:uncharacterized protein N7477_006861 [Penicillium maclennaniae]KAJ5668291.1 hypothetical protein N7477_006861 [Penicillium maclennaniae]